MNPLSEDKKIKVVIADDHPVVLEGLALILKQSRKISVIGFAKNAIELIMKAKKLAPDVIRLDIIMPQSDPVVTVRELLKSILSLLSYAVALPQKKSRSWT
jgi:DNA-binding NarL/FixJ family response regulator